MTNDLPQRKRPVHHVIETRARSTIVFVTVCSLKRQPILDNPKIHDLLRTTWRSATAWKVSRYVIMPDHVHFFAGLADGVTALDKWMRYWKSLTAKTAGTKLWQTGYWDRTLRNDESYEEKWHYVMQNPVRHGLAKNAKEWPYQGEVFSLE